MSNKINISIPKPCHENWQAMTIVEKGRFCDSCQKNVLDFTSSSDREIIKSFEKNHNLCGRFLNTQLNHDLVKPKEKKSIWFASTSILLSLLGIGTPELLAQETVKTEQTDKKDNINIILGDETNEFEISGIVYDESNIPFPGVNVIIQGTIKSTQTDFDGNFKISSKKDDVLVFSYIGMKTSFFNVTENNKKIELMIKLDENCKLQGEVVFVKKRTFFGRTFHSIGNWFK